MSNDNLVKYIDNPNDIEIEKHRIRALHNLNILDTEPDKRYDTVTNIVKKVFNVPIVLVSLVTEYEQWFKSCIGLDMRSTHRDLSFCSNTIKETDNLYIIPDARSHPLYKDHPLVIGAPYVKFYMGCPLYGPNGFKLGTLCIIDTKIRKFNKSEQQVLIQFAKIIETEIENEDAYSNIVNKYSSFSMMIHELVNMISPVASFLEIIQLNNLKEIKDFRQLTTQMRKNITESLKLINELKNLSMNNEDKPNVNINKKTIINNKSFINKYKSLDDRIDIVVNCNILLNCNSFYLDKILYNLLLYSLENSQGKISIFTSCANNTVSFRVIDIQKEPIDKEKLFNDMGYKTSLQLAKKMGGELKIDNTYKKGLSIGFSIPKNMNNNSERK